MLWASVFLLALAVGQVPAKSTKLADVDFIENVSSGDSRIVSGWEARPGQHPHHCNLRMTNAAGQLFSCGGSVVHRNWVLSAAHCTALHVSIVVRAGLVFLNDALYLHETTEWYNHPTYVDEMAHIVQPNDVSLIKLQYSIIFSEYLKPIRLQSRADAFRNYEGLVLYSSGHGRTWTGGSTPQALQWVYLRGVSNFNCQRVFGSAIITDNSICAQYFNVTSQSTCHGDSGGPLVYEDNGVPTLIGVTSFVAGEASGGCHSGFPGGFIRTGPFHAWYLLITGFDFELDFDPTTTTEAATTTTEAATTTTEAATTTTTTEAATTTTAAATTITTTEAATTTTAAATTTTTTEAATTTWKPTDAPTTPTDAPCEPPPTIAPEEPEGPLEPEEPEEPEEPDDDDDCDCDSDDDPDMCKLLKKLEVEVKVKVKMSKLGKKKIHHDKHITHQRQH